MLKIKNLRFSYDKKSKKDEFVINDLSLSLPSVGVFSVMGPSGCGKSTLFSLIAGLIKPDFGEIELDAKNLSFAFQDARLMPWFTAAENVNFVLGGRKATTEKAIYALSELDLSDSADKYPEELSGGMKKRVSLARAFVTEPDFLLLDEPFNGLDPVTKQAVIEKIKATGKNALVLMITHEENDALACSEKVFRFGEINRRTEQP